MTCHLILIISATHCHMCVRQSSHRRKNKQWTQEARIGFVIDEGKWDLDDSFDWLKKTSSKHNWMCLGHLKLVLRWQGRSRPVQDDLKKQKNHVQCRFQVGRGAHGFFWTILRCATWHTVWACAMRHKKPNQHSFATEHMVAHADIKVYYHNQTHAFLSMLEEWQCHSNYRANRWGMASWNVNGRN